MKTPPPTFQNPVLDADFPDPSVLLAPDGYYYAYATNTKRNGQIINLQIARSEDLVTWEYLGEGLPDKPAWAAHTQRYWAPDVSRRADGRYLLYYSIQPDDLTAGMALGVALADSPQGPFRDVGQPLLAGGAGFRDIDPMRFVEGEQQWLFYGSGFGPLRVRELAPDGLSFAPGSAERELVQAAGGSYEQLIEGSWVHRQGEWYYLFYSGNNCCFPSPHYAVLVARAHHPAGPYQTLGDATGTEGTILVENERWLAPGHNSIITDASGQDWLLGHAIDRQQPTFDAINDEQGYARRPMILCRVDYTADGWPTVSW
jgi:arabinan endo-1,5-alpha-L-arabinosidase